MMWNPRRDRVIIVGAGTAGRLLALSLARAGVACELYEGRPDICVGGSVNLASNGMWSFAELGLAGEIQAVGTIARTFTWQDASNAVLVEYPYSESDLLGQPSVTLERSSLMQVMETALAAAGVQVHYDHRLTGVVETATGVTATFANGASVTGDLVVGADGVHSAVRRTVSSEPAPARYAGYYSLAGSVPLDALPDIDRQWVEAMNFVWDPRGIVGWGGCSRGFSSWWAWIPRERPFERAEFDWDSERTRLAAYFSDYPLRFTELTDRTTTVVCANVFDGPALRRWHSGRAMLIGDAAHAVRPNSGQGVSQAAQDAVNLGRLLTMAAPLEPALNDFEEVRRDQIERQLAVHKRLQSGLYTTDSIDWWS